MYSLKTLPNTISDNEVIILDLSTVGSNQNRPFSRPRTRKKGTLDLVNKGAFDK